MAEETRATAAAGCERPAGGDRPSGDRPSIWRSASAVPRVPADRVAAAKVGANIFAARRFANSAWRKLRPSTTKTSGCSRQFVAESGKIVPRRLTGVCTPHQRRLSLAIKQARNIALLPFAGRAS